MAWACLYWGDLDQQDFQIERRDWRCDMRRAAMLLGRGFWRILGSFEWSEEVLRAADLASVLACLFGPKQWNSRATTPLELSVVLHWWVGSLWLHRAS